MASEPLTGSSDQGAETVGVFNNHGDADLAASNLKAHGIHCWIRADDAGGMLPFLSVNGGVRLMVQASDAAAIALLSGQAPDASGTN